MRKYITSALMAGMLVACQGTPRVDRMQKAIPHQLEQRLDPTSSSTEQINYSNLTKILSELPTQFADEHISSQDYMAKLQDIKKDLETNNQTKTSQYIITLTQMGSLWRRKAFEKVGPEVFGQDLDVVQQGIDQKLRTSLNFYKKGIKLLEENPGLKINPDDKAAAYIGVSWVTNLLK